MPTYDVDVIRISYGHRTIRVVADNVKGARAKADDQAGNFVFEENTAEYKIDGARRVAEDLMKTSISARVYSDDHAAETPFMATTWFAQAKNNEILELARCGWGGNYAADVVAEFYKGRVTPVTDVFNYIAASNSARRDMIGFECHVSEKDAITWLKYNRPELHKVISAESFKCDGCGNEEPSIINLNKIQDYFERVDNVIPAGECKACGALSYAVWVPTQKRKKTKKATALKKKAKKRR